MSDKLLSNIDLEHYCKKLEIPLISVGYKDHFENIEPVEGAYILNTESSYKGTGGTHWTCFCIKADYVMYFDSFGMSIPREIKEFIERYRPEFKIPVIYSIDQIQDMRSINCGWFCIYFLYYTMVLGRYNLSYRILMNKHNAKYYNKNLIKNDKVIHQLIKEIFKMNKKYYVL